MDQPVRGKTGQKTKEGADRVNVKLMCKAGTVFFFLLMLAAPVDKSGYVSATT